MGVRDDAFIHSQDAHMRDNRPWNVGEIDQVIRIKQPLNFIPIIHKDLMPKQKVHSQKSIDPTTMARVNRFKKHRSKWRPFSSSAQTTVSQWWNAGAF